MMIPVLLKRRIERLVLFLWLLVLYSTSVYTQQDTSHMIRYTPDFKFKDGIFLNFDQVQQNDPISKSLIISQVSYDNPDFFESILQNKVIQYFDDLGTIQEMQVRNLWGYSRNGVLYININDGFYRINVIGRICHFVADLTTYNNYYNSYYPYASPYYYPYSPYATYPATRTTEMRQFLLDFSTGNVMDYDIPEVEVLLMADPELHDEFTSLSRRKRRQSKFLFIRKYNERNPLYFPE